LSEATPFFVEPIADSADARNLQRRVNFEQFLTKRRHVNVDHASGDTRRIVPNVFENLRAGQEPAFGFRQKPEQTKFERGKRDFGAVIADAVKIAIELRRADLKHVRALAPLRNLFATA